MSYDDRKDDFQDRDYDQEYDQKKDFNKDFNKDIDYYEDERITAAVGGLVSDGADEDAAGSKGSPDKGTFGKEALSEKGASFEDDSEERTFRSSTGSLYKVREYFDETGDEPVIREPILLERVEESRREFRTEPRPPLTSGGRKSPTGPIGSGNEDYNDYLNMTSRQLAEEKKKKGRNSFDKGFENQEAGFVRDASRNPAVRKERKQQDDSFDGYEGRPEGKPGERNEPRRADTARIGAPAPKTRNIAKRPDQDPEDDRGYTPLTKPANKYGTPQSTDRFAASGTDKLPIKGSAQRRNEFFRGEERYSEREHTEEDGPGFGGVFADLRIILGILCLVLAVATVFLFVQNSGMRSDLAEIDGAFANVGYLQEQNTLLRMVNESLEHQVDYLTDQLAIYIALALNPGAFQTDGNGANGTGTTPPWAVNPDNPLPTPIPTPSAVIHVVRPNETLSSISTLHLGTSTRWREIMEYNNMPNENIRIDQELRIPPR